jgi:hypothetical protein
VKLVDPETGKRKPSDHDEFLSNLWNYHGYNLKWMIKNVSGGRVRGRLTGVCSTYDSLSTTAIISGHAHAPLGARQNRARAGQGAQDAAGRVAFL